MAGPESNEWLRRLIRTAACVDHVDVSVDALGVLAETLPLLRVSVHRTALNVSPDLRTEANINFLAARTVPYDTAANLFAAIQPASADETIAFLCRSDIPTADAVRIVAAERRRTTVLLAVAELPGLDVAVYEAVVSAFAKVMQKTSPASGFAVLWALLTNPVLPLASKVAALAVPSVSAWEKYAKSDTYAYACWKHLKSSETLQLAAFDGLSLPDDMLLDCASWQGLSTVQLRVVFAALQRQVKPRPSSLRDPARFTIVGQDRLLDALVCVCDHVATTDEFLTEVDNWFDLFLTEAYSRFDPFLSTTVPVAYNPYFRFTYGKHRRQGILHVDPAEFWAAYPQNYPESLTLFEWSCWTRIPSMTQLVDVLTGMPDGWTENVCEVSWLVEMLTPLIASASSAELLAGLDAAAASGMPDMLADIGGLYWHAASYDALTFDVLRRLRQPESPSSNNSPTATLRLLELLAETLGPDPAMWTVFDQVSVPDATIGEIMDLAISILEPATS